MKVNMGECSVGNQNGHHKEDVHIGKLNLAKYTVAEVLVGRQQAIS
jgi:hypothetical protein